LQQTLLVFLLLGVIRSCTEQAFFRVLSKTRTRFLEEFTFYSNYARRSIISAPCKHKEPRPCQQRFLGSRSCSSVKRSVGRILSSSSENWPPFMRYISQNPFGRFQTWVSNNYISILIFNVSEISLTTSSFLGSYGVSLLFLRHRNLPNNVLRIFMRALKRYYLLTLSF